MSNATTNTPLPPMPAWATEREDIDYDVPGDGFTRFSGNLGRATALNVDDYTRKVALGLVGVEYSQEFEPNVVWIEVRQGSGIRLMLTPAQARDLADRLTKGAATIGGAAPAAHDHKGAGR